MDGLEISGIRFPAVVVDLNVAVLEINGNTLELLGDSTVTVQNTVSFTHRSIVPSFTLPGQHLRVTLVPP